MRAGGRAPADATERLRSELLHLGDRLERHADLARQHARFLRRARHLAERGVEPRRAQLDEIESEIAEREAGALELTAERLALTRDVLERDTVRAGAARAGAASRSWTGRAPRWRSARRARRSSSCRGPRRADGAASRDRRRARRVRSPSARRRAPARDRPSTVSRRWRGWPSDLRRRGGWRRRTDSRGRRATRASGAVATSGNGASPTTKRERRAVKTRRSRSPAARSERPRSQSLRVMYSGTIGERTRGGATPMPKAKPVMPSIHMPVVASA